VPFGVIVDEDQHVALRQPDPQVAPAADAQVMRGALHPEPDAVVMGGEAQVVMRAVVDQDDLVGRGQTLLAEDRLQAAVQIVAAVIGDDNEGKLHGGRPARRGYKTTFIIAAPPLPGLPAARPPFFRWPLAASRPPLPARSS